MLLRCTSTAVQLLALHFGNIQNSVEPSWVLPSPVNTTLRCGRCCVFWSYFLTTIWKFLFRLTVPFWSNCGQLNALWELLRVLTFEKPHTELLTGRKSHFGRDINWLMALFHHRKWGHRELRYKGSLLMAKQNESWELLQLTSMRTANFFTVKSNIASLFYASIPYCFLL